MLNQVDAEIWVSADSSFRFAGLFQIGTRMTVVRLADGGLWLHSPTRLTPATKRELDDLGPVSSIVCPNQYHHMFAGEYAAAYAEAKVYGTPALVKRRKDLELSGVMDEAFEAPSAWQESLEELYIGGTRFEETVFLHRSSRTLITSDLIEYFTEHGEWFTRMYLKLAGTYRNPGFPKIVKAMYKDHALAKLAFEAMLAWDFERMIIAHGDVLVDDDPKGVIRRTYRWLLE
jgi:hypothetical protein